MATFLGIDLGTSSLKAVLLDEADAVVASASAPLAVSRPRPGWSEQDPEHWWAACLASIDRLAAQAPAALSAVAGIGLSGQMHGAVLLDAAGRVLRPAILWNDGRSGAECAALEAAFPELRQVTGNIAMPGFTAPKLLWVRTHEPDVFGSLAKVVLPKAYLRWRLTGDFVEDMSDASGTLWLDVGKRDWSEAALAATGLARSHMPRLVEGSAASGTLRGELAARWGMPRPPVVAGGAGDNAASAVGLGAVQPGSAFVSLGTSGVLWATTAHFAPNPEATVHAFCHALPGTWHQMSVILSCTASLDWVAALLGKAPAEALALVGEAPERPGRVMFLPYLGGERTPHNDADLRGVFAGLAHTTAGADLVLAVLEGVAFGFKDGLAALASAGTVITAADVVGGGARSRLWVQILADVLGLPLSVLAGSEVEAARGAARLGRLAATGEPASDVCRRPEAVEAVMPDDRNVQSYAERWATFRALLPAARAAGVRRSLPSPA